MKRKRRKKNAAVTEAMGGEEDPKEEALQGPSTLADVREEYRPPVEDLGVSEEEDLYRGAEDLPQGPVKHAGPGGALFESTLPKAEDRCSLEPMLDILSYSESEWKGNTTKSTLIRKGYTKLSQRFESLRRVRGDNYCALRATLFQVLSTSTQPPVWLQVEHISTWAEELEAREGLIGQWMFPSECRQGDGSEDAVQQLKRYMELLQNRWQAAVGCSSMEVRQRLCERVFQGGEEELGLLEALKLLMLVRASEFHTAMQEGGDVPVFCWLLYARDSSDCPRTFLSNHLSRVGFSGGLEQVEMFLLGYALQCTIQVYRLYMTDTEEFVTYYPDDHKEDWPCVCLVTEDDRHYNVPVGQHNGLQVPEDVTAIPEDIPPDCLDSKSQADCH
ncbi:ubiquitin thioesterase otulin-like isoform X2 [Oncorhynchus masou masou]|uniref:ubiquitin thioesterase otulin-like isoform X2 n=1 Tax=Oncorhynchus masou masou TaxID=90313 RepID=UPI003183098C